MNARAVLDTDRWADRFAGGGSGAAPDEPERPVDRAPAGVAAILITGLIVGALAVLSFLDVLDDGETSTSAASSTESSDTAAEAGADDQVISDTTDADDAASSTDEQADDASAADTSDADSDGAASDAADDQADDADAVDDADAAADPPGSDADSAETAIDEVSTGELSPRELATALLDAPRSAVFSGGVVYLRGSVPSAEIGEAIAARAAAVVGPENVVNEYSVDPETPLPESAPLYVEDVVLFDLDSATLNPAFVPLLQLGTTLMNQVPTVEITVIAHTDSTGSAEYNLALSERRAEAVKAFWIESGIEADRVTAIGLGEEAPVSPNSGAFGRAANRRAEFIVQGILG